MGRSMALAAAALALLAIIPCTIAFADRTIEERRAVDPHGSIEIVDFSGAIEVSGWNRAEVEVSGSGKDVDRVEITSTGTHTRIRITGYSGTPSGDDTRLTIHVPEQSAVSATLVTATLTVSGLKGDSNLRTVSGNLSGTVGGNVRASTVSGSVHLTALEGRHVEVRTINGDIILKAGSGEVSVTTVSGNAQIEIATLERGRFKAISGNMTVALTLAVDAELEAESITGTIRMDFRAQPSADFDVQSFSGSIDACFGPPPTESHYGPGSRWVFKTGDSHARVRVDTKSGDVHLCGPGLNREHAANRCPPEHDALYVI
jgi:hypothetical protein